MTSIRSAQQLLQIWNKARRRCEPRRCGQRSLLPILIALSTSCMRVPIMKQLSIPLQRLQDYKVFIVAEPRRNL